MDKNKIIFLLILLSAIILRINRLETLPHWFWDEGVNMHISWNLMEGKLQWFCLTYPFVPHPPLYFIIGGILLKIFGNELIVLRSLSVFYSTLTLVLIYLMTKRIFNKNTALLSSFIFAIHPFAIFWNRMAFANNQIMFFSILCLYLFVRYMDDKKERWFYMLSIFVGLSLTTDILGACTFISVIILFWFYDREKILKLIIISSILPIIFVISMLGIMPDTFIYDLLHHSKRINFLVVLILPLFVLPFVFLPHYKKKIVEFCDPIMVEIKAYPEVFYVVISLIIIFMTSENFSLNDDLIVEGLDIFWFGIFRVFLIKEKFKRNILLTFFMPLLILILCLNRADHMLIPLHPYLCIFFSILLYKFFDKKKIVTLLVFYPLLIYSYYDVNLYITKSWLGEEDINSKLEVADFINRNVNISDVVIVDSHMTRFINCKASVLGQAAAIEGKSVAYYAKDYKPERFLFNCSYKNAKFIVITNASIEWAMNQSGLRDIVLEIQNWTPYKIDNYLIFENPNSPQIGEREPRPEE